MFIQKLKIYLKLLKKSLAFSEERVYIIDTRKVKKLSLIFIQNIFGRYLI